MAAAFVAEVRRRVDRERRRGRAHALRSAVAGEEPGGSRSSRHVDHPPPQRVTMAVNDRFTFALATNVW